MTAKQQIRGDSSMRLNVRSWATAVAASFALVQPAAQAFDRAVFDNLDTGIYWYANQSAAVKAADGVANANFNSTKPTVIYIHGWQKDTTARLFRETYNHTANTGSVDVTSAWKTAGWNMGIFYWNQLSDEGEVKDAEAKIWSVAGPQKMRWRKADGTYPATPVVTKTAAQLFFESYKSAMKGYTGNNIRLAGHSLGNQMVIVGAMQISDAIDRGEIAANLLPKRIALLDPAYLKDPRPYLNNRWTGEVAREYVDKLKAKGVIFETVRTSSASDSWGTIGDANTGLVNKTAYREMKPWYFNATQVGEKHGAAVFHYFWEFAFAPANVIGSTSLAASASATDAATTTMMNSTQKLLHDQGAWTKTPADDTYKSATK